MSDCFHELDSRFAGESFFALLCARQFGFAGHARSCSMRLRSTSSPACRFVAGVSSSGEALAYVPAFAATGGFGRHLRATNLPVRVGAPPSVLRSTRALGHRFAARLQMRRGRRWFVESLAATRGDLSRSLRVDEGLLADVAGSSTKGSAQRFRNGRLSLRRSVFSHHSAAKNQERKTANNGAAANRSGRVRASRRLLPAEPAAQPSRRAPPPSAVSELESFGLFASRICAARGQTAAQ